MKDAQSVRLEKLLWLKQSYSWYKSVSQDNLGRDLTQNLCFRFPRLSLFKRFAGSEEELRDRFCPMFSLHSCPARRLP
jgi:hypothetical protein